LKGSAPEVQCAPTFEKVGVYSAVNVSDGQMYSLMFEMFDSEVFKYYLEWLISERVDCKKTVLILDRASPHRAKIIRDFVSENKDKIELLYLPAYSPDLNPVEMIWKDVRKCKTHNRYFREREELHDEVASYLKEHAKPNEKLTSMCRFNYVA